VVATFHHSRFSAIADLVNLKHQTGLTVSVVIPALNEASTIGAIISIIKKHCIDEHPLIDEIIVVDGYSSDKTAAIATENGAKVFAINDIGPPVQCKGKGVALWKSQYVAKGDIVIFIDSDLTDFDQRFIYGLLGVMLHYPEKYLVKSFYNRPLIIDSHVFEQQGGRVTELLAKPLIELFVPQLSGIFQPLSGEYALRRDAFKNLPFWSGYAVEIGLLLDMYFSYGIDCIAQVDMDQRVHRNRPLQELHAMSSSILRVFLQKMHTHGAISISKECFEQFFIDNFMIDNNDYSDIELEPSSNLLRC
jgi:glucosyl-3-phosphoglycerate synthase